MERPDRIRLRGAGCVQVSGDRGGNLMSRHPLSRYSRLLMLLVALAALDGCFNANGSGSSSAPTFGNGDVTAAQQGAHTVNGSVRVPDGMQTGNVGTVNGSIHVGDNATLQQGETVNGSISLGSHSSADSLSTVNGSISLSDDAHVAHAVETVNGSMTLRNGSQVGGSLTNVNGTIELTTARVGGGIRTANGDINVGGHSQVDGGILVQKPSGWFEFMQHAPRVVIGPGAVVNGELRFERKVELYVSDKATIGPVVGATAVRYTGEAPPAG
jgi:hypothetical protein